MTEISEVYAGTRKEWREWLKKNYDKEKKVYLIKYKKHTGKPSLNNKEAMEEAICFGWIDTTIKRLDECRYRQAFVKRNSKSRWSNNTLRYGKDMIKQKKMTPFGLRMYKEGLKKGPMDKNRSKNPGTPAILKKELEKKKNKKLKEAFENLSPSMRKYISYWIERAVRKETKEKRIKVLIEKLKSGEKIVF